MKNKLMSIPLSAFALLGFITTAIADLGGTFSFTINNSYHFTEQIIFNPTQSNTLFRETFSFGEFLSSSFIGFIQTTILQTLTQTINSILPCTTCYTYTGDFLSTLITVWMAPLIIVFIVILVGSYAGIRAFFPVMIIGITTLLMMVFAGILGGWVVLLIIIGLSFGVLQMARRMLSGND